MTSTQNVQGETSATCRRTFRTINLSPSDRQLPPSIPLILPSNYKYDPSCNTAVKKQCDDPVQLEIVDESGAVELLRTNKVLSKPLAVLSICGPYRSGKSYFLSRMLDIRSVSKQCDISGVFKTDDTMNPCTRGIWMATTALECDDFIVLLLDTEGDNMSAMQKRTFHLVNLSPPGKQLPPSIPLVLPSNYEYDPSTNTAKEKEWYDDPIELEIVRESGATELLKTIDSTKPLAIVSICGTYRSGKSYFLSRMLDDNHKRDISSTRDIPNTFKVGHTINPCTRGIWMATSALECDDFILLLLDTEGTDDAGDDGDPTIITHLLVITTLLSSCLIYNSELPQISDLEEMRCFTELSSRVASHGGVIATHFPNLFWLIRDFDLQTEDEHGKRITPTEYIRTQILTPNGHSVASENVARAIDALFPSVECRTIPRPERTDFNKRIEEVKDFLLSTIERKRGFGDGGSVNGATLVALLHVYVRAINSPNCSLNLQSSWIEARIEVLHHTLVKAYKEEMEKALESALPMPEGDLNDAIAPIKALVIAQLEKAIKSALPVPEGDLSDAIAPVKASLIAQLLTHLEPSSISSQEAANKTELSKESQLCASCELEHLPHYVPVLPFSTGFTVLDVPSPVLEGNLYDTPVNAIAAEPQQQEADKQPPATIIVKINTALPSINMTPVQVSVTVPAIVPPPPPLRRNADDTPKILMSIHRKILTQKLEVLQRELDILMPVASASTKEKKGEVIDNFMQQIVQCKCGVGEVKRVSGGVLKQFITMNRRKSRVVCEKVFSKAFQQFKGDCNECNMLIGKINYRYAAVGPAEQRVFLKKGKELALFTSSLCPSEPENLRVVGKGNYWIKIRWDEPLTHPLAAKRYCVLKQAVKDSKWSVVFKLTRKSSAFITDLDRNTKYRFRVHAVNGKQELSEAAEIMVKTNIMVNTKGDCSHSDSDLDSDASSVDGSDSDGDFYD